MRFTLVVTIAMDGSKFPLFAIFKGTRGGSVERSLSLHYRPVLWGSYSQKHGWITGR